MAHCNDSNGIPNDTNTTAHTAKNKNSTKSDVCRWWLRGKCLYGDKCKLSHPPSLFGTKTSQLVRKEFLRENNEKNKKLIKGTKKHWGKKKRTMKESIFRQWLLDNFGRDLLGKSSKYGILDIAGGKGVLSFEFLNLNGIKSTVCDPRHDLNLKRCIRAMNGGYLHKNKLIVERYVDKTLEECLNKTYQQIKPQHLRLFFDEKLINILDKMDGNKNYENVLMDDLINYQFKQFQKFNKDETVDISVLMDDGDNKQKQQQQQQLNEQEINELIKKRIKNDCVKMIDLMRNCCVIIGMHPDYATEFIIDFAMKYKKPFAVLPCCVFPKSFPNRTLNGRPVKQYDDFCDYLMGKHEEICQCTLTLMNGKNKVIYWIPNKSDSYCPKKQILCQLI